MKYGSLGFHCCYENLNYRFSIRNWHVELINVLWLFETTHPFLFSGLNVKQESVTLVAGNQGQSEGGLKVVQVPGSNDFTVVPVDSAGQFTTTEVLNVIEAAPPPDGMIIAVPGSVGALDPDQVDTTTLLSQENPGMIYHRSMLQEGIYDYDLYFWRFKN